MSIHIYENEHWHEHLYGQHVPGAAFHYEPCCYYPQNVRTLHGMVLWRAQLLSEIYAVSDLHLVTIFSLNLGPEDVKKNQNTSFTFGFNSEFKKPWLFPLKHNVKLTLSYDHFIWNILSDLHQNFFKLVLSGALNIQKNFCWK